MTWHAKALTTSYLTRAGAGVAGSAEDDKAYPLTTASWYFLDAVDMAMPAGTRLAKPRAVKHHARVPLRCAIARAKKSTPPKFPDFEGEGNGVARERHRYRHARIDLCAVRSARTPSACSKLGGIGAA